MCEQRNLGSMSSAISSQGSGDGPSPCVGQDSRECRESGRGPVRVSRFRARESDRGTPTSATFGPLFTVLSPSVVLQRCLESRLRARMDVNGSPEFVLTWKTWDMPSGEPICALRASERRTGGSGCSGWPTCSARDWKDSEGMELEGVNPDGTKRSRLDQLPRVAQLAGWPTPTCPVVTNGHEAGNNRFVTKTCVLVSWKIPRANAFASRPNKKGGITPEEEANLAIGPDSTSCPAGTGKRGVLRPGHSRWLMGFPAAWDCCGDMAMRLCRKLRRSS